MDMFRSIEIETSSWCNRACPSCIRNSHPDRKAVESWFKPRFLSRDVIREILYEAYDLDFKGTISLSHYNEPLLDPRIVELVRLAKSLDRFYVFLTTNGDYLTEDLAKQLDGKLDAIKVSLYEDGKEEYVKSLFSKTKVGIDGKHIRTHFNNTINRTVGCKLHRLIINHKGQYLMCCEDLIGNFDLGSFPEVSLREFWFGEKRTEIIQSRDSQPYCQICPRLHRYYDGT